jgi:hypothetical protein
MTQNIQSAAQSRRVSMRFVAATAFVSVVAPIFIVWGLFSLALFALCVGVLI